MKRIKCSNLNCGKIVQWQTDKPRPHRTIEVEDSYDEKVPKYCSMACCVEHQAHLDMPEEEKFNVNTRSKKC